MSQDYTVLDDLEPEVSKDAILTAELRKYYKRSWYCACVIIVLFLLEEAFIYLNVPVLLEPIIFISYFIPPLMMGYWAWYIRGIRKDKNALIKDKWVGILMRVLAAIFWLPYCLKETLDILVEIPYYYQMVVNQNISPWLLATDLFKRCLDICFVYYYLSFEWGFFRRHFLHEKE